MIALAGAVLVASLVGSPHCAAMCGGFACFVAGQKEGRTSRVLIAYHLGRLLAYAALGALAGLLGSEANRLGVSTGLGHAAAPVAGALMVLWGAASFATALGWRGGPGAPAALHRVVIATLHRIRERSPLERAAIMGLVTSLLPCGFLWAFVAIAAGAGSPLAGAVVMAAFWAGTVPVLAGVSVIARRPLAALGRRAPLVTAGLLVILGGLTMAGRLQPAHASHAACCHAAATR